MDNLQLTIALGGVISAQYLATILTVRLMPHSKERLAWLLLGLAFFSSATWQLFSLSRFLYFGKFPALPPLVVWAGMLLSILVLVSLNRVDKLLRQLSLSELDLKRNALLHQKIVDASMDGIWLIDDHGFIRFVNQRMADLLEFTQDEILDRPLFDFLDDKHGRISWTKLRQMEQSVGEQYDFCLLKKDGAPLWAIVASAPMTNAHGAVIGQLWIVTDITDRTRRDLALQQTNKSLNALFEASPAAIQVLAPDGSIRLWNPASQRTFGWNPEETLGFQDPSIPPSVLTETQNRRSQVFQGESFNNLELTRLRKDGKVLDVSLSTAPLYDDTGHISGIMEICIDITNLKEAEKEIELLAYYDPLTSLPNRLLLKDRLRQNLVQAGREKQTVAVLFLDLDHFKVINDTLGHQAGDRLLQIVAERLTSCIRKSDTVGRLGGDEFIVLLPLISNSEDVIRICKKILKALCAPIDLVEQEVLISTSIGVSIFPNDGSEVETLIANADLAMYQAKERGRNNYQFFSAEMNAQALKRQQMETALRKAMNEEQFVLYFQDQVDLTSGRIMGMEALLRWQHPDMGLLLPGDFLPLAEETGLIIPIGEWVLETAMRRAQSWQKEGCPPICITVNLSKLQILHYRMTGPLTALINEIGIDPKLLELEIPENAFQEDAEKAERTLHELKKLGVHIAIDGFGLGFTCLKQLSRLPVDCLKIDHSLTHHIFTDPRDRALVLSIIKIARDLGIQVLAEGARTEAIRSFLHSADCALVQGLHCPTPVTAEEVTSLIEQSRQSGAVIT